MNIGAFFMLEKITGLNDRKLYKYSYESAK